MFEKDKDEDGVIYIDLRDWCLLKKWCVVSDEIKFANSRKKGKDGEKLSELYIGNLACRQKSTAKRSGCPVKT